MPGYRAITEVALTEISDPTAVIQRAISSDHSITSALRLAAAQS